MPASPLEPIGVVYATRNRDGDHNLILVYPRPFGFRVLEGPAVSTDDPLIDTLADGGLKSRVEAALESVR